jgi:hypothetical protein
VVRNKSKIESLIAARLRHGQGDFLGVPLARLRTGLRINTRNRVSPAVGEPVNADAAYIDAASAPFHSSPDPRALFAGVQVAQENFLASENAVRTPDFVTQTAGLTRAQMLACSQWRPL